MTAVKKAAAFTKGEDKISLYSSDSSWIKSRAPAPHLGQPRWNLHCRQCRCRPSGCGSNPCFSSLCIIKRVDAQAGNCISNWYYQRARSLLMWRPWWGGGIYYPSSPSNRKLWCLYKLCTLIRGQEVEAGANKDASFCFIIEGERIAARALRRVQMSMCAFHSLWARPSWDAVLSFFLIWTLRVCCAAADCTSTFINVWTGCNNKKALYAFSKGFVHI